MVLVAEISLRERRANSSLIWPNFGHTLVVTFDDIFDVRNPKIYIFGMNVLTFSQHFLTKPSALSKSNFPFAQSLKILKKSFPWERDNKKSFSTSSISLLRVSSTLEDAFRCSFRRFSMPKYP